MNKHEEILSKYCFRATFYNTEMVTKLDALKAMRELEESPSPASPVREEKISLEELPVGSLFDYMGRTIGLKTEYRSEGGAIEAFIVGSGEMFWGGTDNAEDQGKLLVTPLAPHAEGIIVTSEFMREVYNLLNKKYDWQNDKNAEVKQCAKVDRLYSQIMKLHSPHKTS
jgi:hypothetical protein